MLSNNATLLRNALLVKKLYLLQSLHYKYCDPILDNPKPNPLSPKNINELQRTISSCSLCSQRESKPYKDILHSPCKIAFISLYPFTDREGDLNSNSGIMLKNIIQKVFQLSFSEISIIALLKCTANHSLEETNVANCREWIQAELHLIQPKLLMVLGEQTYRILSNDTTEFSHIQGKLLTWGGFRTVPTYSLADLIRKSSLKSQAYKEFLHIKDHYL